MNSKTKEKFRKLTKFYNSLDFKNEAASSTGPTDHQLRVDLLEALFFDKQNPGTSDEIFAVLNEQEQEPDAPSMGFPPTPAELIAMALYELYQQQKADKGVPDPPPCTVYYTTAGEKNGGNHPIFGQNILYDESLAGMFREDLKLATKKHIMMAKIDSDITSPVLRGSSIVDSYLNYIPNIERSRCVPYLKAKFITTDNRDLVVLDFLGAAKLEDAPEKTIVQLGADYLLTDGSKVSNDNFYGGGGTIQGMEMFTMPQSLIAKKGKFADPFRPLMSLNSANINIYSAGEGFVSFKKASLKLTLFDRTKLNDISFLLDPSRFNETVIELSAGWTHPDSNNIYGAILNEMKVKDLYKIMKSDFSLSKTSTIDITLTLANLGGGDITKRSALVSDSNSQELRSFHKKISKLIRQYQALARKINPTEEDAVEILPTTIIEPKNSKQAVPLDLDKFNAVKAKIKELRTLLEDKDKDNDKVADADLKELEENITALSDTTTGVQALMTKYNDELDKFKKFMNKNEVDLFLEDDKYPPATHISFGKLFLNTVGLPMISAIEDDSPDDVQILMYNFNKYAGEMGYNDGIDKITKKVINKRNSLASFAFEKTSLINDIKSIIDKKQQITVHDIMRLARKKMKSKYDPQYGIITGDNNSEYQKLEKEKDGFVNSQKQAQGKRDDPGTTSEDKATAETNISDLQLKIDAALKTLNDLKNQGEESIMAELGTSKIQMPKIQIYIESNNIERIKDGKSSTIFQVRYHIYDENEKPYEHQEAALSQQSTIIQNAIDEGMKITPGASFVEQLAQAGALKQITKSGVDKSKDTKYKIIGRRYAVKKAIKSTMPSISYGTEATAINSISISGISDKDIDTHHQMEARQTKSESEGKEAQETETKAISEYEAQKIHPVTLDVSMMGCTVLEYGQHIFVDFATNTDLDNVYGIIGLTHSLTPGSFITNAKLTPTFSGAAVTFKDMLDDLAAANDRLMGDAEVMAGDNTSGLPPGVNIG